MERPRQAAAQSTVDGEPVARADDSQSPVLVVTGVSGSGKSTVAALVAQRLGWDFAEGDDMHPAANVAKMAAGMPLDDDDRWPWLAVVAGWIRGHLAAGRPGIITCSALKRSYRDVLRGEHVIFVYLAATPAELARRMAHRQGHFMPGSLLASQLATLEPPSTDEQAISVETGGSPAAIADHVVARIGWDGPAPTR